MGILHHSILSSRCPENLIVSILMGNAYLKYKTANSYNNLSLLGNIIVVMGHFYFTETNQERTISLPEGYTGIFFIFSENRSRKQILGPYPISPLAGVVNNIDTTICHVSGGWGTNAIKFAFTLSSTPSDWNVYLFGCPRFV